MNATPEPTRYIISDLHLGKDDEFDIFSAPGKHDAFDQFLEFCAQTQGRVELIINGDFVDFLQIKPWDVRCDKATAVEKAKQIVKANSRVFTALRRFLQDESRTVVVLLGNHDVELAYDEVWKVIETAIAPPAPARLQFKSRATQYNFRINGVLTHVQHGNIRDRWNEIRYTELFNAAERNTTFEYPPGTLFVYDVINKFKERFRFVDLLKPEMPAVALLLLWLQPLATVATLPAGGLDLLRSIREGFFGQLRRAAGGGAFGSDRPADLDRPIVEMARSYVGGAGLSDLDVERLDQFLAAGAGALATPAGAPAFAPRFDAVKARFVNAILRSLGRPTRMDDPAFYAADQQGADVDSARQELSGDVRIVVFGHTHAALKAEIAGKGIYLNSGAWANIIELPATEQQFAPWLKQITDNSFARTSFLTYARIAPIDGGVNASLNRWNAGREQVLWSKSLSA
jgi:UDP-2,3-diacylglucosamine pyrophosphatase LpxH